MDEQKKIREEQDSRIDEHQKKVKKEFSEFWADATKFIKELFNIRKYADKDFTRETILGNIPFRGHTAWLLIFSIMVASVGLNANSTPVVIGAMLISPLMGPIMGAGFAIGTNDIDTFKKSAINFAVMVTLSLLTSFLYFKLSPLAYESSELLARTSPTFFDVIIAFFGGLAGIVALTKKGFFNVISGVAIATALMPPLCTAGFGLATGNMHFFTGAIYLLFINSFFIALATFLVIKYLHFPVARYINSSKRRNISRIIYILAILVMIPSIMSFIKMYNEEIFKRSATGFVADNIKYEGAQIIKTSIDAENKKINVYLIGEVVPKNKIEEWNADLHSREQFADAGLQVYQSADKSHEIEKNLSEKLKEQILDKLFKENKETIKNKDAKIEMLTNELIKLKKQKEAHQIPFEKIALEAQSIFNNIEQLSYANMLETNFKQTDTIPGFIIKWHKNTARYIRKKEVKKFEKWIKQRLQLDTLKIVSLP
jgi:uncharacterized hydrophobic protein (TIGR00271 family)